MSANIERKSIEKPAYPGIKKIDYTSKLNIDEPPLNIVPTYRILENNGEIVNNCNSIIVSTS